MENTTPNTLTEGSHDNHLDVLSIELIQNFKKTINIAIVVGLSFVIGAFAWFYGLKLISVYLIEQQVSYYSLLFSFFFLHVVILIFCLFILNKKINAITFPLVTSALSKLHHFGALQKKVSSFSSISPAVATVLGVGYAFLKLIGKKKTLPKVGETGSASLLALGVKEVLIGSLINKLMAGFFTTNKKSRVPYK